MNTTPYFKIAMLALGTLVLAFASIWNNAWADAPKLARAPVVERGAAEGVMRQTGWFTYDANDDVVILYCVHTGDSTLSCVAFVVGEKGNAVVLIDDIKATEAKT